VERREDDYRLGELSQAIKTLTTEVHSLHERIAELEKQLAKGRGIFIGAAAVLGGLGAVFGAFLESWLGQ
jgi:hypothetical protein